MSEEERRNIEEEEARVAAAREAKMLSARDMIANMQIKYTPEMPAPIAQGTVKKTTANIQTNVFGLKMVDPDKQIFKYDVFMEGTIGAKVIEFTKTGRGDYLVSGRKDTCLTIFGVAIKEADFYRDGAFFFYDGQHLLFTTEKLIFKDPQKANETIILEGRRCSPDLERFEYIHMTVKECGVSEGGQCVLSDIRNIDSNGGKKDRSAMQFVDIATTMGALTDRDRFTVFPNGKLFPNHPEQEGLATVPMREGKLMIPGMNKSVKLIEGPRGRGNASPAIAIDSLKAVFHSKGKLLDKACGMFANIDRATENEISLFATSVKGVGCVTLHTKKPRKLEIYGISKENSTKVVEVDMGPGKDRRGTIAEYFNVKYNIVLSHPLAPLIMSRERGQINLYPMELLEVLPMQRVTVLQSSSVQSQVATKECAVPPGVRQNSILAQCHMHDLFNPDHPFLKAAGLGVLAVPLRTEARVLRGPILQYGRNEMEADGPWRPTHNAVFAVGASIEKWALYAVLGVRDQFTVAEMRRFAEAFVRRGKERGMKIALPAVVEILAHAPQGKPIDEPARQKIREAAYMNCNLVMFITNDLISIHKHVKLQERYSHMVTQDLKLKTVQNYLAKNQSLTMDNIVYKTNLKMGGMNYGISLKNVVGPNVHPFPPHRLYLGIGVSHAPQMPVFTEKGVRIPAPAVVGYAANMANHPTEFIGDCIFQDSRKEDLLLCTTEMIQNVLDRFTGMVYDPNQGVKVQGKKSRPLPTEIIIYRQGVSEGFYAMCLREEIPLVKAILAKNGGKDVKITYIIAQKEHGVRLMPVEINVNEKPTAQNIGSGVVVDSELTHPRYREFFLNSHITLQGSARTPRYTVITDDNNLSMNELESVTHALCYNFQIVNSPVSIPAPLYVANRYAERGVALYQAKATDELATSDQKKRKTNEDMNKDLGYDKTPMGMVRINA